MRTIAIALLCLPACVNGFQGSSIEIDFAPGTPVSASPGVMPGPGEVASDSHFTLYAFQEDAMAGRLFELERFEIHRIVDLSSPCFIDVGEHVPHPGLHVSQYANVIMADTGITDIANPPPGATDQQKIDVATALQRMDNINKLASDSGIRVVSSASIGNYPTGIPDPTATDEASNQLRLQMCQQYWHDDPNYFEGTDRILTQPLGGITHGMVDGTNPINQAPVGGAQLQVDEDIAGFDGFAIYLQPDNDVADPGTLMLFGTPTMPTRGVYHVHMTSPSTPNLTAELAIFANVDQDNVSF